MNKAGSAVLFGVGAALSGCMSPAGHSFAVTPLSSVVPAAQVQQPHDAPPAEFVPIESPDTVWTIESGTYAGLRVPLDMKAALGGKRRKDHFWRVATNDGTEPALVGWKSTRYPIPIAFRHSGRSRAITSADSIAFWTILSGMNADFGIDLFRPATITSGDPTDVIIIDLGLMREADGLSRVTWAPSGELFDVRVTFHDAAVLHDGHVVVHEMMHALGFGHTTAWRSVVNSADANQPARVTPEDVAYAELAMRSRVTRERADMRRLIALAVARESSHRAEEGAYCALDASYPLAGEDPMKAHAYLPIGLLTVVAAVRCEY